MAGSVTVTAGHDTVVLVVQDDDPTSPADVARWLRERLDGWRELDVLLVGVVVGELFGNARRHGSPPYVLELVLDRWREALVVSVRDRALGGSGPWRSAAGLLLVDGLTDRWGVLTQGAFTTVWAEVVFED
ncbi:ATP-binding protein [Saccharothrix hoggarensis]|uniref:ATP-binding protein n=1 Tax=Saccharothrix hoggarensis TaxID=913853 RepID=A0ABW3R6F6_9PSEU